MTPQKPPHVKGSDSSPKKEKVRLDQRCVDLGLAPTRSRAQALIMAGKVLINGQLGTKAGTPVTMDTLITMRTADHPYVSRGGLKLEAALDAFQIPVKGCVALDVGASTGGFTDCLLQRGARHVIAVDVGHGQLHYRLRQDARVTCLEGVNARYLATEDLKTSLAQESLWPPNFATMDLSFISLTLVMSAVKNILLPHQPIIALVKPQFEAERHEVGNSGVIKDPIIREKAIQKVIAWAIDQGMKIEGRIPSPIHGPKGNIEELVLFRC